MHVHSKDSPQRPVPAASANRLPPAAPLSAAAQIMQLQRTVGNRALGRWIGSRAPAIQRKAIGRLDGYTVQDTMYENNNEATILEHMGGEWNRQNDGAVTGGHLLASMIAKWGNAQFNQANDRNAVNQSGVYFTGSNALPNRITNEQFTFYLGIIENGRVKKSQTKNSTFWPRDWDEEDLRNVLNNSYKTNQQNVFASKQNTSYWYTWQKLGENTVFPLDRHTRMDRV